LHGFERTLPEVVHFSGQRGICLWRTRQRSSDFSESMVPYGIAAIVFGAVLLYAGLA
jgi:hypothetical protein